MRQNPQYILRQIAGEGVLISLESSEGFNGLIGLNGLGLEIYQRVEQYETEEALIQSLCEDFDAPAGEITADARAFLAQLREERLILD